MNDRNLGAFLPLDASHTDTQATRSRSRHHIGKFSPNPLLGRVWQAERLTPIAKDRFHLRIAFKALGHTDH